LELKWSCSEQGCVQVPGGQYSSFEECQEACQVSYNCVQGVCQRVEGLGGEFASYAECSANGEYIAEYSLDGVNWTSFASSNKPISISEEIETVGGGCCGELYEVTVNATWVIFNTPAGTHTHSIVYPGPITNIEVRELVSIGQAPGFTAPLRIFGSVNCDALVFVPMTACGSQGACQITINSHSVTKLDPGPDCFKDFCTLVAISDGEVIGEAGAFEDGCPQSRVRSLGCGV
jgi:hypothetical protein